MNHRVFIPLFPFPVSAIFYDDCVIDMKNILFIRVKLKTFHPFVLASANALDMSTWHIKKAIFNHIHVSHELFDSDGRRVTFSS